MKIRHLLYSVVFVSAVMACSQADEDLLTDSPIQGPEVQTVQWSDVEIRLGTTSSATTRAIIDTLDSQGNFNANGIGVFMLATHPAGTNPVANEPIHWNRTGTYKGTDVVLDNVEANAVYVDSLNLTQLQWEDNSVRYYPFDNWYAYRFYGYYPMAKATRTRYQKRCVVNFTGLDGDDDVIFGASNGYTTANPFKYSAKYFRGNEAETPVLAFEHLLMSFQFKVKGNPDKEGGDTYLNANEMIVTSIQVGTNFGYESNTENMSGVPTQGQLLIASLDSVTASGVDVYDRQLTCNWQDSPTNTAIRNVKPILDADGNEEANIEKQIDGPTLIPFGREVLLPVPTKQMINNGFKYRLYITLKDRQGNVFDVKHPFDLNLKDGDGNNLYYKKGQRYVVTVGISGPKKIEVNATLKQWETASENPTELELN